MPLELVIVSETRLWREALFECLLADDRVRVTAHAPTPGEAFHHMDGRSCAVVLYDMSASGSLAAVRRLADRTPAPCLIGVGFDETERRVLEAAEAGLAGYVPRDAGMPELVGIIERIAGGELPTTPRIAAGLARRLHELSRPVTGNGYREVPVTIQPAKLTAREREIVHLIDEGLSNKQIALALGIELATVKNHVHNLLEKLGVDRRSDAAALVCGIDELPGDATQAPRPRVRRSRSR